MTHDGGGSDVSLCLFYKIIIQYRKAALKKVQLSRGPWK